MTCWGRSKSRLYEKLVKEERLFNNINAYLSGSVDPGLLVVQGRLNQGISIAQGEAAVDAILEELMAGAVSEAELTKVKNQAESTLVFSELEMLNRAMNLAFYANLGMPDEVNREGEKIQAVTVADIQAMAQKALRKENTSTLYYRAKKV